MKIHILGGGTFSHVRSHLALCTPAFGSTAKEIFSLCQGKGYDVRLHLTQMADPSSSLQTNEDVDALLKSIIQDEETKIVFFNVALTDFSGKILEDEIDSGKYAERLKTSEGSRKMLLTPNDKLISQIRKHRKDIFLVGFKTTCSATEDDQYIAGCTLLKKNSCNLVLANDVGTRTNMIITPEQARYSVTKDRGFVLSELVEMTLRRAQLTFTRSTVVEGESISWNGPEVSSALRQVVDHCIEKGAYKLFNGSTVGHFATKVDDNTFLTSKRKTDFNKLNQIGLVKIESSGIDSVIAHGSKPSVGGMSQRIIFNAHKDLDSIVHFHCPPKPGAQISTRIQKWFECGSHECGQNTLDGLQDVYDGIKCVYLDNHGPNIVFNSKAVDPQRVIQFIDENFDLEASTDGIVRG